ncbi:MAG TPA: hypothetical protein VFT60_10830 [Bryobacteraceae bacterium]|nr:hypothetical protein [Bryobacteraceae bacterium]
MTKPQKRRALALLVCIAIVFCVFAFHAGPILWALPAPVCAALIVLIASGRIEIREDLRLQPPSFLLIHGCRAPPALR